MALVIGIDGGGTKTVAAVLDTDAPAASNAKTGQGGPCNIAAMPVSTAISNIQEAVAKANPPAGEIAAIVAAVAGYSFADRRAELAVALDQAYPGASIEVVPDYIAAFTGAAAGGPGIVVIAGTGSVAYGENSAGASHKAGGYGYLIDDSGSGYAVGRNGLAAVLQAADGTGEATTLTKRLEAELGTLTWDSVIAGVYGVGIDRAKIASLAPAVALAAKEDQDQVARAILMHAGGALVRITKAVAARLFDQGGPFDVYPIGSLWDAGESLTDVFARSLARFAPSAELRRPSYGPAIGAALRAQALLGRCEKYA